MKINIAYPYPVLAAHNDDYKGSSFNTNIDVREVFGELVLDVTFRLQNEEINKLIETGSCVYSIHIECSQTSFRKSYQSSKDSIQIKIPTEKLRGKIDIHSFIIAKEKIVDYKNALLNDWFKGIPITFEKGNLLAIGDAIETTLYEDNTELLDLPSIVNVVKSNKNEFIDVDIATNIITIRLPKYEYEQYALNANTLFKSTILSTVIVPSLVYVFSKINENPEDLAEYTWYQVLEKIFEENGMRLEDVGTDSLSALKAAQMVLRKPLKASFEEIEAFNKAED